MLKMWAAGIATCSSDSKCSNFSIFLHDHRLFTSKSPIRIVNQDNIAMIPAMCSDIWNTESQDEQMATINVALVLPSVRGMCDKICEIIEIKICRLTRFTLPRMDSVSKIFDFRWKREYGIFVAKSPSNMLTYKYRCILKYLRFSEWVDLHYMFLAGQAKT